MSKHKSKESKAAPKATPEEKPLEETNVPMVDHVVTQEDLDNNPELVGKLNVGDVIQIPADESEEPLEEPTIEDQSLEGSEESKTAAEDPESSQETPEEPQAEEDVRVEEKPLEEENKAPEEEPAPELTAPWWCDKMLWDSLSLERKQQLIRGENFRE